MEYNWLYILKSVHIVGFVAWFAGLFYLVRMFVYHTEAFDRPQPEQDILKQQLHHMEIRVYKAICSPAMMVTFMAGLLMLALGAFQEGVPNYLSIKEGIGTPGWMHLKLVLVILLLVYHLWSKRVITKLQQGERVFNSFQFRLLNEIPTVLLTAIVFTASLGLRGALNYAYLFGGIAVFIGLLWYSARSYKSWRETNEA